jgi:hypothetical protein
MEEIESVVIQAIGFLVLVDSYLCHFSPLMLRACSLSELHQNDQQAIRK